VILPSSKQLIIIKTGVLSHFLHHFDDGTSIRARCDLLVPAVIHFSKGVIPTYVMSNYCRLVESDWRGRNPSGVERAGAEAETKVETGFEGRRGEREGKRGRSRSSERVDGNGLRVGAHRDRWEGGDINRRRTDGCSYGRGHGDPTAGIRFCHDLVEFGHCNHLNRCKFSHDRELLRQRRQIPCFEFMKHGRCLFGKVCTYWHDTPALPAGTSFRDSVSDNQQQRGRGVTTPLASTGAADTLRVAMTRTSSGSKQADTVSKVDARRGGVSGGFRRDGEGADEWRGGRERGARSRSRDRISVVDRGERERGRGRSRERNVESEAGEGGSSSKGGDVRSHSGERRSRDRDRDKKRPAESVEELKADEQAVEGAQVKRSRGSGRGEGAADAVAVPVTSSGVRRSSQEEQKGGEVKAVAMTRTEVVSAGEECGVTSTSTGTGTGGVTSTSTAVGTSTAIGTGGVTSTAIGTSTGAHSEDKITGTSSASTCVETGNLRGGQNEGQSSRSKQRKLAEDATDVMRDRWRPSPNSPPAAQGRVSIQPAGVNKMTSSSGKIVGEKTAAASEVTKVRSVAVAALKQIVNPQQRKQQRQPTKQQQAKQQEPPKQQRGADKKSKKKNSGGGGDSDGSSFSVNTGRIVQIVNGGGYKVRR
jgi:hypothetical protein